jgi:cold shock protein
MPVGIVKWYDRFKGFGFIVSPDGVDVFVHFTAIEGSGYRILLHREKVEYEARQTANGLQATIVRHLSIDGRPWQPSVFPSGSRKNPGPPPGS